MEFLYVNLFIGILTLIFLFLKRKFSYWKDRGVPYIEPVIPFGNAKGLGKKMHISDFMINMYQQLKLKGPIGGIYIFIRSSAVVTDLDLVRQILVKDFSTFPNRGAYYNEADDPLSAHLVNIEDDKWRNLRAKLTPTFTSGKLKMMFQTVLDVSDHLIEVLDKETADSGQLEIKDLMARFTTDVIGSVAFGIDCNSLNDKTAKFYQMGLKSFSGINFIKRFMTMSYRNLARNLHVKNIPEDISKFYMDVVKDTVNYREKNPEVKRNDFMNLLIQMKNSKGSDSLTMNQIAAQSFVFFLAGYETSSTTLTFCMYELSMNEDVQEQARKDAKESIEKHDGEFSYEAVNNMHYLDQCINGKKLKIVSEYTRINLLLHFIRNFAQISTSCKSPTNCKQRLPSTKYKNSVRKRIISDDSNSCYSS